MSFVTNRMSKVLSTVAAAAMIATFATAAQATEIVVHPGDAGWTAFDNGGGGSSAITGTAARSGNGSIEMTGDKTRFGTLLAAPVSLSSITSFGFDWMVDPSSTSNLDADYTPALRLHLNGSELIWEGAYNGVPDNMTKGTWYVEDIINDPDVLWQWVTGVGPNQSCAGGALCELSVSDWATQLQGAEVLAISVGAGSTVGDGYLAFADNIVLGIDDVESTYNFEVTSADVPEPAALALFGVGLLGLGLVRRRKQG